MGMGKGEAMIYGCDIASWQGKPDFALLKAQGHDFMVTKVTGEGNYINPYWRENRAAAHAAGLLVGFYDWTEPQGALAPDDAAADYLRAIGPLLPGEFICVDFETPDWFTGPDGRNIESWMKVYLYELRDKAQQPIIVYTGDYFLKETGADKWAWLGRDFLLWVAAPGPGMMADDSFWPGAPSPFGEAMLHQHQWYATSDAVVGQFDRDRFIGAREELAALGCPDHSLTKTPVADLSTAAIDTAEELDEMLIPEDGKVTAFVTAQGKPVFIWNAGGETTPDGIVGINIQDLGMSVKSATEAGVILDRSIQHNAIQMWNERRNDSAAK